MNHPLKNGCDARDIGSFFMVYTNNGCFYLEGNGHITLATGDKATALCGSAVVWWKDDPYTTLDDVVVCDECYVQWLAFNLTGDLP